MDKNATVSNYDFLSQFLLQHDVYEEFTMRKWCYKYQPKGKRIIIVSHYEKEKAMQMMHDEIKKLIPQKLNYE